LPGPWCAGTRMPGPEGAPVQQCTGATRLVDLVLAQDPPEMVLIPDQGAVQEFAPTSPNPALGYRVGPHRQLHPFQMIDTAVCG
jgi:hypothetical protein